MGTSISKYKPITIKFTPLQVATIYEGLNLLMEDPESAEEAKLIKKYIETEFKEQNQMG
jgi:hypothetical protein